MRKTKKRQPRQKLYRFRAPADWMNETLVDARSPEAAAVAMQIATGKTYHPPTLAVWEGTEGHVAHFTIVKHSKKKFWINVANLR